MPRRSQAQLIHAKASAKAQLINAHQMGGGAGGSAPLVHAPTPYSRRDYTRFSPVTEVGGDKKKDKPAGVAIADKVDVSGKGRTVNDGSGLTQWRVGNKRFTQAEFDNIMDRGMRGASLNAEQRAVFEASRKEYEEEQAEKKRLAEEKRVRDIKQAEAIAEEQRRNDEWDRRQKVQREAQLADEQRQRGYAQEDFDRRQQAILDADKRAADAEAAKYEELNARHGIEKGVRLSAKDYNDLEAGRVVYDYSKQDNDDIRSAAAEIEQRYRNGEYDQAGYEDALRKYNEKVSGMKKSIRPNENPPTAEQLYNGAFTTPNGTMLLADGKGGLVAIPGTGPQKETETLADKNARIAQERKDKWLDSRISELLKMTKKTTNGEDVTVDVPIHTYDTAYQQAMKDMAVRFPAPTSSAPTPQSGGSAAPTPAPTTQESTPTPQPDDIKNKWSQYED